MRYTYMNRNIATILSSLYKFSNILLIIFVNLVTSINFNTLGSLINLSNLANRVCAPTIEERGNTAAKSVMKDPLKI